MTEDVEKLFLAAAVSILILILAALCISVANQFKTDFLTTEFTLKETQWTCTERLSTTNECINFRKVKE